MMTYLKNKEHTFENRVCLSYFYLTIAGDYAYGGGDCNADLVDGWEKPLVTAEG